MPLLSIRWCIHVHFCNHAATFLLSRKVYCMLQYSHQHLTSFCLFGPKSSASAVQIDWQKRGSKSTLWEFFSTIVPFLPFYNLFFFLVNNKAEILIVDPSISSNRKGCSSEIRFIKIWINLLRVCVWV